MFSLRKLLSDPAYESILKQHSLDSPEVTIRHREIILKKKFLKKLYTSWYQSILKCLPSVPGKILEIGSGGGFIKEVRNDIITSDILPLPHCEKVVSAADLPFESNELRAIILVDTFHHLPDCGKFLSEAQRTLNAGGKIIMIEPASTLWARFIYKNFHHEPFDGKTREWKFPSTGPLSGANIALPWIVFFRDYAEFRKKFPLLELASVEYHTPFAYLISGGFPYKSLLPSWGFDIVKTAELVLSPLSRLLGMFMTIVIVRK
ncbi:MAG: methyltransferase domain-containing protein [Bacteroidetes bacterium]|nr:methyltransferase domain-containing protein [Bacteroidota bacterium]